MPHGTSTIPSQSTATTHVVTPRLGFLGVGWIGRHRLQSVVESDAAQCVALADPAQDQLEQARFLAPDAVCCSNLEMLLEHDLDGIVIATPSALHARQAIRALESGIPVFCQKPLGRTAEETRQVLDAARRADRLLGVDMSYRHVEGVRKMKTLIEDGELGRIFAADLTFHNAYGPDKDWFYDPEQSGGGCVIDLGIHLVDLALWMLDFSSVENVSSRLFAGGEPLSAPSEKVEDYAIARLDLASGAAVELSCSWNLHAGGDAVIEAAFYGTEGGVALRNVAGSFYDFQAEHFSGTDRRTLAEPPDAWGGRSITSWARQLSQNKQFDASIMQHLAVAKSIDAIYHHAHL